MFKKFIFSIFVVGLISAEAQTAISGYVDLESDTSQEPKVYLAKLDVDNLENLKYTRPVAWSPVKEDGSFSFDRKHLSDEDAIYRLYVGHMEEAIKDTIANGTIFILSKYDSIYFPRNETFFADYTSTNMADREWKKLQAFETELLQTQLAQEDESSQLKSYAKDSLRILMVKLIGIQQLDEKDLLDQDIAKNPDYYLALLAELKESEMPAENYLFLEKKLAFLTQEVVEQKYAWSKTINFILGFFVLGLGTVLVFRRKKQPALPDLSKQERTIQNLILQGMTNKEIANELFISISTVKTHITNIYSKLKVSSRQELLQKTQN